MKNLVWLTVLLSMISSLTCANDRPSWYPSNESLAVGQVITLTSTKIAFDDEYYILSPTVKFSTLTLEKATSSFIKKGGWVGLKLFQFNNKTYVDHIYEL
ncbi:MAG: hypothetical protein ISR69_02620 [Gammaproteobacteria bacterium]|nr:hypothetical protein [Gammaproteobacteria bacterium]